MRIVPKFLVSPFLLEALVSTIPYWKNPRAQEFISSLMQQHTHVWSSWVGLQLVEIVNNLSWIYFVQGKYSHMQSHLIPIFPSLRQGSSSTVPLVGSFNNPSPSPRRWWIVRLSSKSSGLVSSAKDPLGRSPTSWSCPYLKVFDRPCCGTFTALR